MCFVTYCDNCVVSTCIILYHNFQLLISNTVLCGGTTYTYGKVFELVILSIYIKM